MRARKALLASAAVVAAAAALFGALVSSFIWLPRRQEFSGFAMGSALRGTLWAPGLPFPSLSEDFTGLAQSLESQLKGFAAEVPPDLLALVEASDGAFNPYLGALTALWDIEGEGYIPTQEEIDQALRRGFHDPGAYGKGLACDAALDRLTRMKVTAAVFNLGGNILTYGKKPWGKAFKIALRDPLGGPNDAMGTFTLRGTHFISTSGSYEKYFERDGKRYHHIFDPSTGRPAETGGLISVTVLSENGTLGDALSTACFVLGYEKSIQLLKRYGGEAIFVYADGDIRFCGGPNLPKRFEIQNKFYHWS